MATYVEFSLAHTTGSDIELFDTAAEAVEASTCYSDKDDNSECEVLMYIDSDGDKSWGVGAGVQCTFADAKKAEKWYAIEDAYTDNREIAEAIDAGTY